MRHPIALLALCFLVVACKEKTKFVPQPDAGPICDGNQQLIAGECRFVCQRDGDCGVGERCNLFTGQCELKPPPPDGGPPPPTCTTGAVRCTADKRAIERCQQDSTWMTFEMCPQPGGFCQNEKCLTCQPGAASCVAGNPMQLAICLDDGSATRTVTCSGTATCQANECRECTPNAYRCNPAGTSLQQCQRTSDETASWKWTNVGDNFDGTCITGMCRAGGTNGSECVPPACFPGQIQCKAGSTTIAQTCNAMGAWADMPCPATAECQAGVCVDECTDAVAAKSYFGCEYWTSVQDNSVDAYFKGNTMSGQGSTPSEFAFVVANRSVSAATVVVTRVFGGAPQNVATVTVPGRNDAATKGLMTIPVPWQSISPASNAVGLSSSGQARYGYKLSSTKPLTVYQFNPLSAVKFGKTCTGTTGQYDCNCDEYADDCIAPGGCPFPCAIFPGDYNNGICDNAPGGGKKCRYNTFSNDASLLLPAHILGTSYVAVTEEHTIIANNANGGMVLGNGNGVVNIVGTQDNTTVTVKSTAITLAGGAVPAFTKGQTRTFVINSYDTLQIASDTLGNNNVLQCAPFPFGGSAYACRQDNDLSGTVLTSDKPIAVFGGAACDLKPYDRAACDHVEEQIFPFSTWGKTFVAVKSSPWKLVNGQTAACPGTNCPPDNYKIVSGCPTTSPACPNGTNITITPPNAVSYVFQPTSRCPSLMANGTCRLTGITTIEFKSGVNFKIDSDQPINVVQFFPGQGNGTGSPTDPSEGDPSMVLLPPIEQWRGNYTVLAGPTFKSNYLGLAIQPSRVQAVVVDGTTLPANSFTAVGGSGFAARFYPVPGGTHVITVTPNPVQPPLPDGGVNTTVPGAGVTVYGYDSYVSYGYTGGLDLQTIVTGINPGG